MESCPCEETTSGTDCVSQYRSLAGVNRGVVARDTILHDHNMRGNAGHGCRRPQLEDRERYGWTQEVVPALLLRMANEAVRGGGASVIARYPEKRSHGRCDSDKMSVHEEGLE